MKHRVNAFGARLISIRFTVGGLFILATLLTAFIAISFQCYFSMKIAKESTLSQYAEMSQTVRRFIQNIDDDAIATTSLLAKIGGKGNFDLVSNETEVLQIFSEAMRHHSNFYSIYIADPEDNFFQLLNLESSSIVRKNINATPEDRWVVIKVFTKDDQRIKHQYYFKDDFTLRLKKEAMSNYYPTKRPWYSTAGHKKPFKTEPYLFHHIKTPGQTYSIHIPNSDKVLGLDIVLSSISDALSNSSLGKAEETQKEAFIYKSTGEAIASNRAQRLDSQMTEISLMKLTAGEKQLINETRALKVSNQADWGPVDYMASGKPQGFAIDLLNIISSMTGLKFNYINGFSWLELVEKYNEGEIDVLHSVVATKERSRTQILSQPLYELPFTILSKDNQPKIQHIDELSNKKIGILAGWGIIKTLEDRYPNMKVIPYPSIKDSLNAVVNGEVDAAIETGLIAEYIMKQYFIKGLQLQDNVKGFYDKNVPMFHIMMKKKDAAIINLMNKAIANISEEQKQQLIEKWHNVSDKKGSDEDNVVPYLPLIDLAKTPELQNHLIQRRVNGQEKYFFVSELNKGEWFSVVIPRELVFDQVNQKIYFSIAVTILLMAMLSPLAWIFSSPIVNPISLLEAQTLKIKARDYDNVQQVDTRIKEVWELSLSMVLMAQDLKKYEKAQEEFVEAFIQLIAQAIDDKSPYTAGHCNRVPELGMLLASAAEESTSEAFKSFKFKNDDERREFRIAAWLHDCGKITTPEHIVDKGTKLEANYNRIHEVRMRFEVLWRDAEIKYLKALSINPNDKAKLKIKLESTQNELQDDFLFVAAANVGSECMSDDKIARIHQIAEKKWDRYFDDKVGLSPLEDLSVVRDNETLPVQEYLLSDKSNHIINRERDFMIDPKFGIKMEVPECLYNLGEIYNLTIKRGTLTPEDRFKINEHMISTIKMLESLPFPQELARVPRYASTHHETLKGTGYPRKLMAKDLSIPERILVLSDIFEALTAADRPYKKAKTISLALKIIRNMVLDDHVDKEVFNLFLQSGVYLVYAETYLQSEQIDEVDIAALMID
uniref:3'3'-cGAMP-specific phosphodiesterase 1 n=1 Tax=Aliivibrio wodanis TaxID=80852 RepID=A0A5Q4ZMN8_9GAMM|nr:3'3'-cGAMP-specific phosphodiesterase 1 [Aliivibrio wodanis]